MSEVLGHTPPATTKDKFRNYVSKKKEEAVEKYHNLRDEGEKHLQRMAEERERAQRERQASIRVSAPMGVNLISSGKVK